MKSRNFLHTHSSETNGSAGKGFLLTGARHSPQDVAGVVAVRRFERQHNQSPRFARRRQERRQGQALLLAVLIMLLAALLSAGFLAVVSGNLNQSARVADKTRAIEASRAGIAYANAQLSGSAQGDLWRPIDVSPAPDTTDAAYNFYYSQLEKVQGWAAKPQPQQNDTYPNAIYNVPNYEAAKAVYRGITYGKFPDPNQVAGDAPKFLVKVREVPANPADPEYEADHVGEIKITSIGLSEDDPNVFNRAVAYKSGRKKSPWASALRSVSNWKFGDTKDTTGVPFGDVNGLATANPSAPVPVSINNREPDGRERPQFSEKEVPFDVVIVKKDIVTPANSTVRGAVVTGVATTGNTTTLTLAKLDNNIIAGETIQKAAAIGTGSTIDLLNVGNLPTGAPATFFDVPPQIQPNGILANGSVWLQNQIQLSNLSKNGTKLFASGSLAIDNAATDRKVVLESGDVGAPNGLDPTSNRIVNSAQTNFPGNIQLTAAAVSDGVKRTDLIQDGWNKIRTVKTLGLDYVPDQARTVKPFVPTKLNSAQNLARYRALTRNSANGVYIDNRDDVEKVGTGAMSQAELLNMLTSEDVATPYYRNGVAAATGSLEQRHLRGWVGADEFLARGALVELVQNNAGVPALRVTYDSRSDGNPDGPDQNKTFRDANGNLQTGVYSRLLPWPSDGTLFAEGNIRIRGSINLPARPANGADPYPSLTVVSMNNIYIEGSVSVDNRFVGVDPAPDRKKLMLLAKSNVIVNPTRAVVARTDVQTITRNTAPVAFAGTFAAPDTQTLAVANALLFNRGDYVTIGTGTTKSVRGLITNVDAPNDQISVKTADTFTVPVAVPALTVNVRSALEERQQETTAGPKAFFSLVDTERAVNRRVVAPIALDAAGNRNRIIFDHLGELKGTTPATKEGLRIKAEDFTPTLIPRPVGFTAVLTNKQPLDGANPTQENLDTTETRVTSANKILRTYNNFSTDNKKPFNEFPSTKTFVQFIGEINGTQESTGGPNPEGYRYTASFFPATTNELNGLRSNALAGVGLRYDPQSLFVPPANPGDNNRRQNFNTADGFTIPLATSVEYDLNSNLSNLRPTANAPVTKYIGFDPNTGVSDSDDALTVDSSFYQFKADIIRKSTIDSRVLDLLPSTDVTQSLVPQSIVLKRANEVSDVATPDLLPKYWMRSMKLENFDLTSRRIKPVMSAMQINAFIYAQEGSWLIIPSDYFRPDPLVRGISDANGTLVGSYIDYDGSKTPDPNEYILAAPGNPGSARIADLNRNGREEAGERDAALRFLRYNSMPIQFLGAIIENQTAIVADVKDGAQTTVLAKGAVQDWMDKWATYDDTANGAVQGSKNNFKFIDYKYDPSLLLGSPGADQLRVPVTDDLLYQQ